MLSNRYSNFVKPSLPTEVNPLIPALSGEDASRIYLEEIKESGSSVSCKRITRSENRVPKQEEDVKLESVSKKDLFICVQNNDVITLKKMLNSFPNLLNTTDEFGWSLLMIACQANSVDTVKELLNRGINTSVRDRAGNSAQSLVIKNRNFILADILLSCKASESVKVSKTPRSKPVQRLKEKYFCEICNKEFPDKEDHLSSTVHNIDASKGKKVPANYVIPSSNKGYQLMLKGGWDKESGLGPDGSGKKYPIKTVQKKDRKGLGLDKRKKKIQEEKDTVKHGNRKLLTNECRTNRSIEINFRRQFY